MSNLKKKIALISIIICIMSLFTTTVHASEESERKAFWDKKYKAIGTNIAIGRNSKDPFGLGKFETYCVHHKSGFHGGYYTVHYYIELDGSVANRYDKNGKVLKTWTNQKINGTLEYILAEENYKKSGTMNQDDKFDDPFEKEMAKTSKMTFRNRALWDYMPKWMGTADKKSEGAINKLGIDKAWRYDKSYDSKDKKSSWYQKMKEFIARAEKAATTATNPSVTSVYKKVSNVKENKKIIGPFKLNYTGNELSLKVYNKSDKEISKVEFYSDRNCTKKIEVKNIKSGQNFYIKNNSDDLIKNIKAKTKGTKLKAQLWFVAYKGDFKRNSGQELMIVKSSKDTAESEEITIDVVYKTGDLKIIKTDEKTREKLEGVQFKVRCGLGWIQEKLDKNGNYTYVQGEDGLKSAKIFTTDKNGEALVPNLLTTLQNGYHVYEVGVPENKGYSLEAQANKEKGYIYNREKNYIYINKKIVIEEGQTKPLELKVTNHKTELGKLKIIKKDKKSGKGLNGVKFKIYANGKGWVQAKYNLVKDNNKTKDLCYALENVGFKTGKNGGYETACEFVTNENGVINISNLPVIEKGYIIYETGYNRELISAQEYDLKEQNGLNKEYKYSKTYDAIKIDKPVIINAELDGYTELEVVNKEHEKGSLKIIKTDEKTGEKLEGVTFKIYANGKGWLQKELDKNTGYYTFLSDKNKGFETAQEFVTDKNGERLIENLPIIEKGYVVYETKPAGDYNLKEQADSKKGYEYVEKINALKINKAIIIKANSETPEELKVTNQRKIVEKLEGMVWVDVPDTKANSADNVYKKETKDTLKEGIKVYLKSLNGDKDLIADKNVKSDANGHYVLTDKNGHYEFNNLNLNYADVENAYVEFEYDNNMYTLVNPLEGTDATINSKAKEKSMTAESLEDEKIKNHDAKAYPGRATTEPKKGTLTTYYNEETYTVSNINLGLLEKIDPEYNVSEALKYVKVRMKGYTYTYKLRR